MYEAIKGRKLLVEYVNHLDREFSIIFSRLAVFLDLYFLLWVVLIFFFMELDSRFQVLA